MSRPDPTTLKCCFCGAEHTFADQSEATSVWNVEENGKGEMFALCAKDARNQLALDERSRLIMGKPPRDPLTKPDIVSEPQRKPPVSGIVIKATFKLINVEVSSGGKILSGEQTPVDAIQIDKDLSSKLEIGKEYYVNL